MMVYFLVLARALVPSRVTALLMLFVAHHLEMGGARVCARSYRLTHVILSGAKDLAARQRQRVFPRHGMTRERANALRSCPSDLAA
jgi:hypothetical protein